MQHWDQEEIQPGFRLLSHWSLGEGAASIHKGCRGGGGVTLGIGGNQRFVKCLRVWEVCLTKTIQPGSLLTHYPRAQVQGLVGSKCSEIFAGLMSGWVDG